MIHSMDSNCISGHWNGKLGHVQYCGIACNMLSHASRIEIRKENKNKSNSMLVHPPKRSDLIPRALLPLSCPFLPSIPVTLCHPETTTVADVSQGRGPTTLRLRFSIRQHGRSNVL
jgi:hypothetical protein